MSETHPDLASRFEQSLKRHLGSAWSLQQMTRLSGGASHESWAANVVHADGTQRRLVLRLAPAGRVTNRDVRVPVGPAVEAAILRRMLVRGVPVPEVIWEPEPEEGLGRGFVSAWCDGETIGHRIVRKGAFEAGKKGLAFECGRILARIHATPIEGLPSLPVFSPAETLDGIYRNYCTLGHHRPVFEVAFRWLKENLGLAGARRTLVHGDFRTGNYMLTDTGITAVLDWEVAHLGDPVEDLGWFCIGSWQFGRIDCPAGGVGTRAELLDGYHAESGIRIAAEHLRFWEVCGTLSWGVDCLEFVDFFRKGDRSVERAAIGRRASETEIDLLRLLYPRGED